MSFIFYRWEMKLREVTKLSWLTQKTTSAISLILGIKPGTANALDKLIFEWMNGWMNEWMNGLVKSWFDSGAPACKGHTFSCGILTLHFGNKYILSKKMSHINFRTRSAMWSEGGLDGKIHSMLLVLSPCRPEFPSCLSSLSCLMWIYMKI